MLSGCGLIRQYIASRNSFDHSLPKPKRRRSLTLSTRFASAPALSNRLMAPTCPRSLAAWRGVKPPWTARLSLCNTVRDRLVLICNATKRTTPLATYFRCFVHISSCLEQAFDGFHMPALAGSMEWRQTILQPYACHFATWSAIDL